MGETKSNNAAKTKAELQEWAAHVAKLDKDDLEKTALQTSNISTCQVWYALTMGEFARHTIHAAGYNSDRLAIATRLKRLAGTPPSSTKT